MQVEQADLYFQGNLSSEERQWKNARKNKKKVLTFVFWGAIIHKSLARATSRAGKLRIQLNENSADERAKNKLKKLEKSS